MIKKIVTESNGDISYFYLINDFLDKNKIKTVETWLESYDDFNINYNYTNTKSSRLQKWFHKDMKYFCSKWKGRHPKWEPHTYDSELNSLSTYILDKLSRNGDINGDINNDINGATFKNINSCLINKYLNGSHYIKPHRDTDIAFGIEPTIIGLSIGQSREIVFKRTHYYGVNKYLDKLDRKNSHLNFSFTLHSGSIFIMSGSSQKYWTHEIPKDTSLYNRYSLTFRHHIL